MKASWWIGLLGVLVLVPLAIRTIELVGSPPFEVGLPEGTPTRADIEGLAVQLACGEGRLDLRAERAYAGHEQVLYFRLGPSTFVDLRRVVAEYREDRNVLWQIRGPRARLEPRLLQFFEYPAHREGQAAPRVSREITIDLESGRLEHE